jgi:formiminotetrahydrofolate cyclodeaminase
MGAIKKIEDEGNVTLVDEDTGAEGEGSTVTVALVDLAINLQKLTDESLSTEDMKNLVELAEMTAETQKRFEEEGVEESDVEEAVEWARKQKQ